MVLPIDIDFAAEHGYIEATCLALLRKNEVMRYSARMSTSSGLFRLYHLYQRRPIAKALERLNEQGYVSRRDVYIRGKYPYIIYSLTDKAWREYNFGE